MFFSCGIFYCFPFLRILKWKISAVVCLAVSGLDSLFLKDILPSAKNCQAGTSWCVEVRGHQLYMLAMARSVSGTACHRKWAAWLPAWGHSCFWENDVSEKLVKDLALDRGSAHLNCKLPPQCHKIIYIVLQRGLKPKKPREILETVNVKRVDADRLSNFRQLSSVAEPGDWHFK